MNLPAMAFFALFGIGLIAAGHIGRVRDDRTGTEDPASSLPVRSSGERPQ